MKTKTILSIAIIAVLPFAANANTFDDNNYNYTNLYTGGNISLETVPANGMVTKSSVPVPYTVVTITDDDATHIASTAYVKGAYNNTIGGINALAYDVNQTAKTIVSNLQTLGTGVGTLQTDVSGLQTDIAKKRVSARTTWGSDATVQVELENFVPIVNQK